MGKRVLFWTTGVDAVLSGESKVAGIQVQQSRWAITFAKKGWDVFCLSDKAEGSIQGVHFVVYKTHPKIIRLHLSLLGELVESIRIIRRIKPGLIICRGSGRYLYILSKICRLYRVKLVFFGASDVNFIPGKDIVNGSLSYTKMYRKSIPHISGFVVQNDLQASTLKANYHREALIMPNIWIIDNKRLATEKTIDCIWVSNLRKLKRAEWFINAARQLGQYRFIIVGGASDQSYFEQIKEESNDVSNLKFMGAKPMGEVSQLISQSRFLACTSEYEGFPNTFIQAWANSVPVISTVDPSNIISRYNLGRVVETEEQFVSQLSIILKDLSAQEEMIQAVNDYFVAHHDADSAYMRLEDYLKTI